MKNIRGFWFRFHCIVRSGARVLGERNAMMAFTDSDFFDFAVFQESRQCLRKYVKKMVHVPRLWKRKYRGNIVVNTVDDKV